jgi:hypothetical protein
MPTFWFSYSTIHGIDGIEPPNSPYVITWNLGRYLRERVTALGYEFRYVNLDDTSDYDIGADDVVLAHAWHPEGFLTKTLDKPVKARFLIQPYQHDIVGVNESWWIKRIVDQCDHFFAITGKYWYDTMHEGLYGDWEHKTTRLDMAINPALHPHSKRKWNPQGKRAFLAIGADIPYKGLDMIAELARVGGFKVGYYGAAPLERFAHVPQFIHYGGRDFTPDVQAMIANEYDAFISLAYGDANPTTLLETACWGMLPMCNTLSGYWPDDPFLELRKGDMLHNLKMIDYVQEAPEYALRQRAAAIRDRVVCEHGWDTFVETVWSEVAKWL